MPRRTITPLVCAAALAGAAGLAVTAGPAAAVVTAAPRIDAPAFTKGVPDTDEPGVMTATVRWAPPVFSPPSADDLLTSMILAPAAAFGLSLRGADARTTQSHRIGSPKLNGQRILISLAFCVSDRPCPANSVVLATSVVDGTPPSATMRIDGGAPFTNDREVSLEITAEDPLIEGQAGTSSGITQIAVDGDGDGALPCSLLPTGDVSGCARAFAPTLPAILPEGDGPKTVGVVVGDGAREMAVPCTSVFCVGTTGQPILGNATTATDTIVLDTTPPVAAATQDVATAPAGRAVAFTAAPSSDPGATPSGADPATATWDFGDGSPSVTGGRVTHAYSTAGTFTGRMTVADRAGNRSAPEPFTVAVTPAPPSAAATTEGAPLTLTALRTACARRATVRGSTPAACRRQVVLTLSRTAQVRLTFRTSGPRSKVVGRITRAGVAGLNRITLPRTLLGKLGAGRHLIQATATAGGTTTPVRAVPLVIPATPNPRRA